jgi:FlaA1/EpsC-like NDP-sugar epimerase
MTAMRRLIAGKNISNKRACSRLVYEGMGLMTEFFKNKRILVTGASGTVGKELVRQLLEEYQVAELIGIDNNESDLFFLGQQFAKHRHACFCLADVRDSVKMVKMMRDVQIVFHTAAFKHVVLCERSPFEAVQTNILGIQNVINAAMENHVERVIFTSSDKAVNPTNVMGTSKLMGERIMTAANSHKNGKGPIFASTRFGNVLGSRGSVIPIFRDQITKGGPVTLTHPVMTRFIMSIDEAVRLVADSARIACGGEVFITKMPVIRILDLAQTMIEELAPKYGFDVDDIKIETIGVKPGEKMYEELMSDEETRRALELELYFSVMPAWKDVYDNIKYNYKAIISEDVTNPYNSKNEVYMPKSELRSFLYANNLLYEDPDETQHHRKHFLVDCCA